LPHPVSKLDLLSVDGEEMATARGGVRFDALPTQT
jgi:hypothetical protein